MDSSSGNQYNLKVAIRIRPMLLNEIEDGYEAKKISVQNK